MDLGRVSARRIRIWMLVSWLKAGPYDFKAGPCDFKGRPHPFQPARNHQFPLRNHLKNWFVQSDKGVVQEPPSTLNNGTDLGPSFMSRPRPGGSKFGKNLWIPCKFMKNHPGSLFDSRGSLLNSYRRSSLLDSYGSLLNLSKLLPIKNHINPRGRENQDQIHASTIQGGEGGGGPH